MNNKMLTVPYEWVEHYAERLEECCGYEQAEIVRAFLAEPEGKSLDDRLKAAGMFSVAELLAGAPLDGFMTHAGMRDLATFIQWVEMKRAEYLRIQGRYDLGEKTKDDLYEWTVAHSAVFAEVHLNLKAALLKVEPVSLPLVLSLNDPQCPRHHLIADGFRSGADWMRRQVEALGPLFRQPPEQPLPVELAGVAGQLKEGAGFWSSCSGCHESEDGHPVGSYSYSKLFGCALGGGCSECGGIGAVWDNVDYTELLAAELNGDSDD